MNAWVVKYTLHGNLILRTAYDSVELESELSSFYRSQNASDLKLFMFDGATGTMLDLTDRL